MLLSPHFDLLDSDHFYYMNLTAESELMKTDIGLLDKPDLHNLKLAYVSEEQIAFL